MNFYMTAAALSAAFALACSESSTDPVPSYDDPIPASALYVPHVGEVWTFANSYGDTTTITIEAAPDPVACRSGRNTVWHYRKTAARAYWLPRVDGAELRFVLHQDPDGSWRSISSVISLPVSCPWCNGATSFTWQILDNRPGEPSGYQIIPPTLRRGQRIVVETHADALGGPGIQTLNCVVPPGGLTAEPGHGTQWRTEFYIEDISTAVYTGPASVSEQWENCNPARTNVGCGHEKWWFAPGLGLVKVWQINSGSGIEGDEDRKLIMERVR